MNIPRLVIAGTHSGVGKTTITSGLMQTLANKGLKVQGLKVGPDYIDPSYHTLATNRYSRNVDTWLLGENAILELMSRNCWDANITIIEGVMGFYDGFGGNSELGSTAHIAKITKSPVVLVIDARSMGRSVAALVYGYKNIDPDVNIAGIILNKVASPRHLEILSEALEPLKIPIVGYLFRDTNLGMPERHLGLIPAEEMEGLKEHLKRIAEELENKISLTEILKIAQTTEEFPKVSPQVFIPEEKGKYNGIKIGYAWDKAFSFYYRDSLDFLEYLGVELIPISPLKDSFLPRPLSGLLIGGGFPELFLEELSANKSFMYSIQEAYALGLPIYAECGGFMYLTNEIFDFSNNKFSMTGLIPGRCFMTSKLAGMGYREGMTMENSILGPKGTYIKGHEFHYSSFEPLAIEENFPRAFSFNNGKYDGYVKENLLASYLHMHFISNPELVKNFLNRCWLYDRGEKCKV